MRFLSLSTAGGASLLLSLASSHLAVLARAQANVDNDGPLSPATSGSCADPLHRFVNGHCVPLDLSTDLSHCGQLNHVCPERYQFSVGDVACVAGRCTSECVDGRLFDADKQACVDVLWDAMNWCVSPTLPATNLLGETDVCVCVRRAQWRIGQRMSIARRHGALSRRRMQRRVRRPPALVRWLVRGDRHHARHGALRQTRARVPELVHAWHRCDVRHGPLQA